MARRLSRYLSFTMKEDGNATDARGLVPLAAARKTVARATPKDDRWGAVHAALCSLHDAPDALRTLKRLGWFVGPRFLGNVALAERYGDALLPWLETLVGKTGKPRRDSNVEDQLQQLASPASLALLFRIWAHADDPDAAAQSFLEFQRPGWAALAELSCGDHVRAHELLAALAKKSPSGTKRDLAKAIGARGATQLLAGTATSLDAATILSVLDAAAKSRGGHRLPWPGFRSGAGHFEYHAMRMIAARARDGDDWGVMFEVVQGDAQGVRWPATIQQYLYGSRVATSGGSYLEDVRKLTVPKLDVDPAVARKLDLRRGRAASSNPFVLRVRAALARDRGVFWNRPAQAIVGLELGPRAEILVATDAFAHVVGKQGGKPAILPSKSPTYRSLATAIATRDASLFVPGKSNTDWRLHVR